MADWVTKKGEFVTRKDALDSESVNNYITELNASLSAYMANPTTATQTSLRVARDKLKRLKDAYASLHNDIMLYIKTKAHDTNFSDTSSNNTLLMAQIAMLEDKQKKIQVEVESAIAREEVLRSRMQDVSRHQLFILDRPVRRGMIPYLWVLSVLFVGVGVYIFRLIFPPLPAEGLSMLISSISSEVLTNTTVLYTLVGCLLLTILFLVLKILGVFGK
jgi:hypothetical protein